MPSIRDSSPCGRALIVLRSTVPERIGSRATAQGRLVFEPLPVPPAVAAAMLILPGVRVGEATYELKVEVRF